MPNLTEEQLKKAFDKLKESNAPFPITLTLKVGDQVTKITFYEDGSYKEES